MTGLNEEWQLRNKFRIRPGQPLNTSVFEEATVLEINGALTKAGLSEYCGAMIPEGSPKPIIDFVNI